MKNGYKNVRNCGMCILTNIGNVDIRVLAGVLHREHQQQHKQQQHQHSHPGKHQHSEACVARPYAGNLATVRAPGQRVGQCVELKK